MPDYHWPPMEKRRVIGKRTSRLDGPAKSAGKAKYSMDVHRPGLLQAVLVTSPHAHARITKLDASAAEALPGVKAVHLMASAGSELQWEGAEVAAVAATTEEIARDAARKVVVEYEVLPHVVREEDLSKVGDRAKPTGDQTTGDPDKAFSEADAVSEGTYAIPVITHCCLESHGAVIEWKGNSLEYWPSTQAVSSVGGDLGQQISVPASNIHVHMDYMGGGFGSKFASDAWGGACAQLSKKSGGQPVKLFLDRATELKIAGNRPSVFAKVKMAGKKDGTITAWQSETWSTGGFGGGGLNADLFPYVFRNVPNRRIKHTAVKVNAGSARAWRAPMHPQVSFVTCSAMEDLAAKLNVDSMEFFIQNAAYTNKPDVYRSQLKMAADLANWKTLWHPRGEAGKGHVKRGLGIGVNTWGGGGHDSHCRATIHPDGSVDIELGSQDLGTGTRTVIAMVAAETLGLPIHGVRVKIGQSAYPSSGASGGSTTVGGVSSSTRKATVNALDELFAKVAPALGAAPTDLEAVAGKIQVKGNPAKSLTWKAACQKLGVTPVTADGANVSRTASREGLNTSGVAGVQVADVSVDIETGVVRINRIIAVQDCGLIINPKTAESQIFGACIMSVCGALYEERIMDRITGRMMNPDMEFYKLAGIDDIGEIIVHLDIRPEHDKRGVIGLGEPPAIGGIAAISNAVANAVGVRVPMVPLTPRRVLTALEGRNA